MTDEEFTEENYDQFLNDPRHDYDHKEILIGSITDETRIEPTEVSLNRAVSLSEKQQG